MQAGYEKTSTAMMSMMAGASLIYGPGMLDSGLIMDPALLVADADIINMLKCAQGGVPVNDEALCLDVIREVGIKGEYLSNMHTFQNFKTEQSCPKTMVRDSRDDWAMDGKRNMYDRSMEKAKAILAAEPKEIIPASVQEEANAFIAKCTKEWA